MEQDKEIKEICKYSEFDVSFIRSYLTDILQSAGIFPVYEKEELLPECFPLIIMNDEVRLGRLGRVSFGINSNHKTYIEKGPVHFYEEEDGKLVFIGDIGKYQIIKDIIDTLISIRMKKGVMDLTMVDLAPYRLKFINKAASELLTMEEDNTPGR